MEFTALPGGDLVEVNFYSRKRSANHKWQSKRRASRSKFHFNRLLRPECLEERLVLAAVTVGNDSDIVNGIVTSITNLINNPGADGISMREALEAANNTGGDDTVNFAARLAGSTINLGGTELEISDDVTVTGLGTDQLTIDAQDNSRVLFISGTATANISGLTMTGGSASGSNGGGLLAQNTTTTLDSIVVKNNTATGHGGGVFSNGTLTITNNTISGNTSTGGSGGGIYHDLLATGDLTIENSTLSGNSANGVGGAIRSTPAFLGHQTIIRHSTLTGNDSGSQGGGFSTGGGTTTISHSLFTDNTSPTGSENSRNGGTVILDDFNLFGDDSVTTT